jgi:hypothetical protein
MTRGPGIRELEVKSLVVVYGKGFADVYKG